jgi:hypothetical protein
MTNDTTGFLHAIELGLGGETARLEIIEDSVRGDRSAAPQPAHA